MYRTVLGQGAAKGPNFAGHYTVVAWGCGSSCTSFAIVDSLTGRVIFPQEISGINGTHFGSDSDDFESEAKTGYWGLRFRLDSKLLVLVGAINEDEKKEGASYYLLEDGRLRLLYSVLVNKRNCP